MILLPMCRDTVPTVLISEWNVATDMFSGETASGPVPRLFALNPGEAKANISRDPARAHKDLQRIFCRLAITETIPAHTAFDLVLSPR